MSDHNTDSNSRNPGEKKSATWKLWLKRLGFAGFLFFLIKGLLWLLFFALLAFGIMSPDAIQKIKDVIPGV